MEALRWDVKEFLKGDFKKNCSKISLLRNGDSIAEFEGPGEIWRGGDNKVHFKLAVDKERQELVDFNAAQYLRLGGHGAAIPDTALFGMEAIALTSGQTWRAERIFPEVQVGKDNGGVLSGVCEKLRNEHERPFSATRVVVVLYIGGEIGFPSNTPSQTRTTINGRERSFTTGPRAYVFQVDQYKFELIQHDAYATATIDTPSNKFFDGIAFRLLEALEFTLGKPLELVATTMFRNNIEETILRSPSRQTCRQGSEPPVIVDSVDFNGSFKNMLESYLRFVIREKDNEKAKDLYLRIDQIISAASLSLDEYGGAISRNTEGLIDTFFEIPIDAELEKEVDQVRSYIRKQELPMIRERTLGFLGELKARSGQNVLKKFVEENMLNDSLFDSWKTLRRSSAHGKRYVDEDKRPLDAVSLLRFTQENLFLFYAVVSAIIDYKGPRIDYLSDEKRRTTTQPVTNWKLTPKK